MHHLGVVKELTGVCKISSLDRNNQRYDRLVKQNSSTDKLLCYPSNNNIPMNHSQNRTDGYLISISIASINRLDLRHIQLGRLTLRFIPKLFGLLLQSTIPGTWIQCCRRRG